MNNLYTLLFATVLPSVLNAQSVLIYQNSFVTPLTAPVNASCQPDFSATPVNTLWQGTGAGTFSGAFQQSNTVETLLINGPADIYDDPANANGDFCLGMLNTNFTDKLALLIDREALPFINISLDMSAINTTCGGPFTLGTPNFLVEALDAPGGVFNINSTTPLSSDTLIGIAPNAQTGAGSFVFNWATDIGSLDVIGSTDDFVAIRFTLLNTGLTPTSAIYAAFDNIYIEASTTNVISGIAEHALAPMNIWPNPATDRVTIEDLASGTPVEFFTLTGQRVAVRIAQRDAAIDISALAPGTYVLRARADGSVRNARFVKW
ncbi:MAG: T9SS type A sorting domain-containing protein [Flavobacteriales bacterium]|nr:T9SS type A sorting domain-containing protein [Flavobacteriales bacterium]